MQTGAILSFSFPQEGQRQSPFFLSCQSANQRRQFLSSLGPRRAKKKRDGMSHRAAGEPVMSQRTRPIHEIPAAMSPKRKNPSSSGVAPEISRIRARTRKTIVSAAAAFKRSGKIKVALL